MCMRACVCVSYVYIVNICLIQLQVLSRILERQIEVIQATGTPYIIGDEFSKKKRIILTYHRYMYELGAHYNSVTKFVKEDES